MMASIGVDCGSKEVRCIAIDNSDGRLLAASSTPIAVHNPLPEFYEQSCTDIWSSVCASVNFDF